MKTVVYSIPNINCNHCVHTINSEIGRAARCPDGGCRPGFTTGHHHLRTTCNRSRDYRNAHGDKLPTRSQLIDWVFLGQSLRPGNNPDAGFLMKGNCG